jgi:hypothetical protein
MVSIYTNDVERKEGKSAKAKKTESYKRAHKRIECHCGGHYTKYNLKKHSDTIIHTLNLPSYTRNRLANMIHFDQLENRIRHRTNAPEGLNLRWMAELGMTTPTQLLKEDPRSIVMKTYVHKMKTLYYKDHASKLSYTYLLYIRRWKKNDPNSLMNNDLIENLSKGICTLVEPF